MPLPRSLGFILVTSAGIPVRLASVQQMVSSVRLQPRTSPSSANVGNIYIGSQDMNKNTGAGVYGILSPEQVEGFQFPGFMDLAQIWIDADNSGDGVLVGYGAF